MSDSKPPPRSTILEKAIENAVETQRMRFKPWRWSPQGAPAFEMEESLQEGGAKNAYLIRESAPWGCLNQESVAEEVAPRHEKKQHTRDGSEVYPVPDETYEQTLLSWAGGEQELINGVQEAYLYVAEFYEKRHETWHHLDVMAPCLSCHFNYLSHMLRKVDTKPILEVKPDDINVKVLGVWLEDGSADSVDKIMGYSWDDIRQYVMEGFTGASDASPRRLVAAVRIKAKEAYNVEYTDEEGEVFKTDEEKSEATHYWVLETDLNMEEEQPSITQWRIRNINDAVSASEGEKRQI